MQKSRRDVYYIEIFFPPCRGDEQVAEVLPAEGHRGDAVGQPVEVDRPQDPPAASALGRLNLQDLHTQKRS